MYSHVGYIKTKNSLDLADPEKEPVNYGIIISALFATNLMS